MTDAELIARLRGACYLAFDDWCLSTAPEAADRIEQLVATNEALGKACTEWAEVSQSNYQRAKTSEANLTKAVEALQWCSGSADFNEGGVAREGWLKVCAPLLKGDSHE